MIRLLAVRARPELLY
jgi:hypothetical protein